MAPENAETGPYPLYNISYTLYRVSPLYTGSNVPLDNSSLAQHARRFREILVGDTMRGARIGLASENNPVSAAGKLDAVTWKVLPFEEGWDVPTDDTQTDLDNTAMDLGTTRGIKISVEYERGVYSALLLRQSKDSPPKRPADGFQNYPLLLTKMPASLRDVLITFLSETFDTRISTLHLTSKQITASFERYASDISTSEDGNELPFPERSRVLRKVLRETEVYIGFHLPGSSGALKTMEIHLLREDIPKLLGSGKMLVGNSLRKQSDPFMEALGVYVKSHLGMDLGHERVKVVRIACGAFVLGAEGRIKISDPSVSQSPDEDGNGPQARATSGLIDELIKLATGVQLGHVP